MRHYIEPISGDLRIVASEEERATLREHNEEELDNLHSDEVLYDTFETLLANSELQWVSPDELGALTSAPILGIYDETGTNVIQAWWYPAYEIRSPQQDLMERGECVFKLALK